MQQPTSSKPNAFVEQSSLLLPVEACCQSVYPAVAFFLGASLRSWVHKSSSLIYLTDSRLLEKNIETNLCNADAQGSAIVRELTWGYDQDPDMVEPLLLGSDVVYIEGAVNDLLETLLHLSGPQTTIILAGKLLNDAILEYFLDAAFRNFVVGHADVAQYHPGYTIPRVVMCILVKKTEGAGQ